MKLTRRELRGLINESVKLSFKPQATPGEKDQMKDVLSDLLGVNDIDRSKGLEKKPNTWRPLINVDKKGVAEHYTRLGVLEELFPLTRSCEVHTTDFSEHCGECWFCKERLWGFGRYV